MRAARRALSSRVASRDHLYRLLGIKHDALPAEVRAGYILKVKENHPDVCRQPGAAERFREVSRAYQILIDPQQRKMYDQGMSDEEIAAGSARRRGKGTQQSYAAWKNDMFKFYCNELGIGDPYEYAARVTWQADFALQSVRQSPRDFTFARRFVHDHSGLLVGMGVATLMTGGVPIVCLAMYKLISVLDRHSDALLEPGGLRRFVIVHAFQPCVQAVNGWQRRARDAASGAYARARGGGTGDRR